ncbi:P-loop containing nucleoside triphosphate hydrolase protein [Myxozyma melibiosi]|uniref:Eukaryotic peptide chain release factor GTP-binding subunit n=1 Tax=Myxozyma melibiosi TaxID=54550 RepID=A0ABR1FDN4_9ASCO
MSNEQNVPKSWEQASQDDYNQLPQQTSNLNISAPPNGAAGYDGQQQQQQQQQPYYQYNANNYYNYNGQYAAQPPQGGYYQQPQQPQQPYQQGGYQGGYNQPRYQGQQYQNNGGRSNNNSTSTPSTGGNNWRQGASGLSAAASDFRPSFVPRQVQQQAAAAVPTVPLSQRATTSANGTKVLKIGGDKPKVTETAGGAKVLTIGGSSDPKPEPAAAKEAAPKETVAKEAVKEAAPKAETAAPAAAPAEAAPAKEATPKAAKEASTDKEEKEKDLRAIEVVDDSHKIDDETIEDLYGKEHLSIIFMGHVDAGKSTMGGNLLFLTGTVDKRTMEKFEKEAKDAGRESWYLSWVLDLTKEERSKGKTVEVGRGYFETEKRRYTILDAPGHKTYVPSMIGGASQADVGILVISARKGEYETGFERGGQTREHAVLAKNQGVNKLIIAVNKMDDPTVGWSKERYDECTGKLAVYLRSLGFKPKEDVIFMPVSAYSGANLKDRVSKEQCPWYDGPSLLEYLDNMPMSERKVNAPFMMPIGSKYRDLGTMVEGKIESGHAKRGSQLLLMPNKVPVEVLTIYNETENEASTAVCGEQVKLRLKGVEEEDVQVGFVLSSVDHPVHTVTAFEAQIAIIELKSILSAGFTCVIHVHTAVEEVTFAALLHKLEKGTNRKSRKPPAFATRGMKIIARLEVVSTTGFCIEKFDDYPQLGRFTLRDQGNTIAIGKVTKLLN